MSIFFFLMARFRCEGPLRITFPPSNLACIWYNFSTFVMLYLLIPNSFFAPISAWPRHMLQIFSVKVMGIMGSLHWPLDVYGHVAVRDALDHKRNYLFRRIRGNCQTLPSPQASASFVINILFCMLLQFYSIYYHLEHAD